MSSTKPTPKQYLYRYTTLPVLLDMLVEKRIVLLNPSSWEDRNDAYYLKRYKEKKDLKTILGICFTKKRETFHHWKIFAGGPSGVCVKFDKEELLKSISEDSGFRWGDVDYRFIKENQNPEIKLWPFLKRDPFTDEREFRIVYQNKETPEPVKNVQIGLSCIKRVTLSPWMPASVAKSVKSVIAGIEGCKGLKTQHSQLLETDRWKAAIKSI